MAKKTSATDEVLRELRAYGMAYPGVHFKSPWPGHMDLAVKDKTFAYLSCEGEPLAISCKLPRSSAMALLLKAWIDESYRAQAPKKLEARCEPARALHADDHGPEACAG